MWLLHLLPDNFLLYVVNATLLIGTVGTVLSFFVLNRILILFPVLAGYYRLIQIVSVVLLLTGVYLKGGYNTEMQWRERVAEVEAKLEKAKKESAKANKVIETKIITRTKIIKEKGDVIVEKVDRLIPVEKDCSIPKEAISIHNEAARLNKAATELLTESKK